MRWGSTLATEFGHKFPSHLVSVAILTINSLSTPPATGSSSTAISSPPSIGPSTANLEVPMPGLTTADQLIDNKVDCTGVSAWQKSQAYPRGSKVVFNGYLWVAVQWTTSNTPGDTSATWKGLGVCA
ncbi:hypothetical protein F5I97DRAFT_1880278 [Phlebopus sp. FC_14]|nr:hypothetical protein F5I97DRAFT_1880278 [Phlebopus sp. FC_14]